MFVLIRTCSCFFLVKQRFGDRDVDDDSESSSSESEDEDARVSCYTCSPTLRLLLLTFFFNNNVKFLKLKLKNI